MCDCSMHIFLFRSCWRKLARSGQIGWWSFSTASSASTCSRSLWPSWAPSCLTSLQTQPTGRAWLTHLGRRWPSKWRWLANLTSESRDLILTRLSLVPLQVVRVVCTQLILFPSQGPVLGSPAEEAAGRHWGREARVIKFKPKSWRP